MADPLSPDFRRSLLGDLFFRWQAVVATFYLVTFVPALVASAGVSVPISDQALAHAFFVVVLTLLNAVAAFAASLFLLALLRVGLAPRVVAFVRDKSSAASLALFLLLLGVYARWRVGGADSPERLLADVLGVSASKIGILVGLTVLIALVARSRFGAQVCRGLDARLRNFGRVTAAAGSFLALVVLLQMAGSAIADRQAPAVTGPSEFAPRIP